VAEAEVNPAVWSLSGDPNIVNPESVCLAKVFKCLRLVEADRVGTPGLNATAANAGDGIVFDA
jgi:hypothetical protein